MNGRDAKFRKIGFSNISKTGRSWDFLGKNGRASQDSDLWLIRLGSRGETKMRYVSWVIIRHGDPRSSQKAIEIRHVEFFERAVTFPIYPHHLIGPPIRASHPGLCDSSTDWTHRSLIPDIIWHPCLYHRSTHYSQQYQDRRQLMQSSVDVEMVNVQEYLLYF